MYTYTRKWHRFPPFISVFRTAESVIAQRSFLERERWTLWKHANRYTRVYLCDRREGGNEFARVHTSIFRRKLMKNAFGSFGRKVLILSVKIKVSKRSRPYEFTIGWTIVSVYGSAVFRAGLVALENSHTRRNAYAAAAAAFVVDFIRYRNRRNRSRSCAAVNQTHARDALRKSALFTAGIVLGSEYWTHYGNTASICFRSFERKLVMICSTHPLSGGGRKNNGSSELTWNREKKMQTLLTKQKNIERTKRVAQHPRIPLNKRIRMILARDQLSRLAKQSDAAAPKRDCFHLARSSSRFFSLLLFLRLLVAVVVEN